MLSHLITKGKKPTALDRDLSAAYVALGIRDANTVAEAGLARKTLIDILTRHADLLNQQGESIKAGGLFSLAIQLADESYIDELASENEEASVAERGQALMRRGHFVLAIKLLEKVVQATPEDGNAQKNLAALYHRVGEGDRARTSLTKYYADYPLEVGNLADESAPAILCMYGYDKTQIKLGLKDESGFRRYRSGGHFMLQHLLDQSAYNLFRYTIAADNINDKLPPTDHAIMINSIADADTEYNSLKSLEVYLANHPEIKVINDPTSVLATTRDDNYEKLNALPGFRFPKTQRFSTENTSPQAVADTIEKAGFTFPFIIRETGTHTAVSTVLLNSRFDLEEYLTMASRGTVYAIEFIENATVEGYYSKIRFFSIDGQLYPVVYHTDQVWNVHGGNRKTFMASHEWMIEREQKFLNNPASIIGEEVYRRLQELPELIGLDFFGFDFTLLESGEILIFELNPAMRHSFKHGKTFPYMMPHLEAISEAFDTMVRKRIEITQK
ncbi:hypothetical protein [Kordiimonas aquimaris]|uniref:hypothetical protein n=1 Tax=Kordiimonas aquimaris TaxID=707591 RepID=UPI0021CF00BC|nr:hypothetical protein [Kordiimonas aquimaris]